LVQRLRKKIIFIKKLKSIASTTFEIFEAKILGYACFEFEAKILGYACFEYVNKHIFQQRCNQKGDGSQDSNIF